LDLRTEEIWKIVEGHLPDTSYYVVDVKLTGRRGNEKVVVFVDGDQGISIDICAGITRSLSDELDDLNMFEGSYTLEVSSPGVDYPLKTQRQYLKNLGRSLNIDLISGTKIKGNLIETDNSGITVKIENGKYKEKDKLFIPYSDIKRSKVLVTFK
jgi:ribosome maturation factor RimP